MTLQAHYLPRYPRVLANPLTSITTLDFLVLVLAKKRQKRIAKSIQGRTSVGRSLSFYNSLCVAKYKYNTDGRADAGPEVRLTITGALEAH